MADLAINFIVRTDVFAGISAVMAYWLWVIAYGMATFVVQHKYRYMHWLGINPKERADACLNLGCATFFTYAATQRSFATYDLAFQKWSLNTVTSIVAPAYMPLALLGLTLVIWWLCFHRHEKYRRWWCNYMWTGMMLFAIMMYVF